MRVHDSLKERFEELDEQRRRIDDDFNLIVGQMRAGTVRDEDRLRIEVQQLYVKHQGILREMIDSLVP
jgi:hypothetical protein